jgi:hypothetical protein
MYLGEERESPITGKDMVIDFDNLAKMAWQDQVALEQPLTLLNTVSNSLTTPFTSKDN